MGIDRYFEDREFRMARESMEMSRTIKELREQRDALLAACEASLEWLDEVCNPDATIVEPEPEGVVVRAQIQTAIAKAKGEK